MRKFVTPMWHRHVWHRLPAGESIRRAASANLLARDLPTTSPGKLSLAHAVRPCCVLILCVLAAGVLPGCFRAIGVKRKPEAKIAPATRAAPLQPLVVDPAGTAPVSRMTVNRETVEAANIWKPAHTELADQARKATPASYAAYLDKRATQLITDKIAEMLLHQHALDRLPEGASKNIDKYVEAEIRKIIVTEHAGKQRTYEKLLASEGRTLADVREGLRREITVASYLERDVKPKVVEPTRAELMMFYEETKETWRRPARRRMSLIDVRVANRLPAASIAPSQQESDIARAAARAIIETARSACLSGGGFAEVAQQHSDGLHAADGGAWGWVARDSVRERFVPAVDALHRLRAGQISEVIETDDAFFLVRCDEIDPGYEPDFKTIQPQIRQRHFRVTYNRLIAEIVENLRRESRILPADLSRFQAAVVEAAPALSPFVNR